MRSGLVSALVALCVITACSEATGTKSPAISGTYALVSVNGAPVPVVTSETSGFRAEVLSGTLVIRTNETWTETRQGRVTLSGVTSNIEAVTSGTYTNSAGQLVLTIPPSGGMGAITMQGTFADNAVTFTTQGSAFRFTR